MSMTRKEAVNNIMGYVLYMFRQGPSEEENLAVGDIIEDSLRVLGVTDEELNVYNAEVPFIHQEVLSARDTI